MSRTAVFEASLAYFLEPIALGITTRHVPAEILHTPAVAKIADTLRAVGARSNQPLFLAPSVLQTLKTVDLRPTVKGVRGIDVKRGAKGKWLLSPHKGAEDTQLEISGQLPATAKKGDVLLVHVSAQYPKIKGRAARTVEFLEFVHVTDKKHAATAIEA